MEEESVARFENAVDEFEAFEGVLDALGIGAGLVTEAAMLDAANFVGAADDLQAAVFAGVGIDGDHDRGHVGKEAAVLIPVAVILVPVPCAAGEGFLDAHLGVVMVDFVAEERFHGIDNTGGAGDGAPEIFASLVPEDKFGHVTLTILEIVGFLLEGGVGFGGLTEDFGFLRIEELGNDEETVAVKGIDLRGRKGRWHIGRLWRAGRGNRGGKCAELTFGGGLTTPRRMSLTAAFSGFVEYAPGFRARPGITHVLFDFDGTLSLIREGWPEIMLGMFVEMLPGRAGEEAEAVRGMLFNDMMELNGKQTIYQMIRFAERVKERRGEPKEPLWYKHEYLRRLEEKIRERITGLQEKRVAAEEFLVMGTVNLLENLRARGMQLYLASGTDELFVKREAELLGVTKYFGPQIYGARDDYKSFSKKMVIERILAENAIAGERLLAFGDGYVEIQNTKEAGGLAVAVASDEANNGSGNVDEWKRNRLLGVGADIVIADYRDAEPLLEVIFGR